MGAQVTDPMLPTKLTLRALGPDSMDAECQTRAEIKLIYPGTYIVSPEGRRYSIGVTGPCKAPKRDHIRNQPAHQSLLPLRYSCPTADVQELRKTRSLEKLENGRSFV